MAVLKLVEVRPDARAFRDRLAPWFAFKLELRVFKLDAEFVPLRCAFRVARF